MLKILPVLQSCNTRWQKKRQKKCTGVVYSVLCKAALFVRIPEWSTQM